jgi:hypothetical protein
MSVLASKGIVDELAYRHTVVVRHRHSSIVPVRGWLEMQHRPGKVGAVGPCEVLVASFGAVGTGVSFFIGERIESLKVSER